MWACFYLCVGLGVGVWYYLFYYTNILFIIGSFSYNITNLSWFATSYSCTPLMVLVWSYHWWLRYPFTSMPLWKWAYNNPWHTSRYYCLLFWRVDHMFTRRFPTFSLTTPDDEWIFLLLEMVSILWWTLSLLTRFA